MATDNAKMNKTGTMRKVLSYMSVVTVALTL